MSETEFQPVSDELIARAHEAVMQRLHDYRLIHSLNVADTAASLAEFYGVPVNDARLAGLLHDWDKEMSDEELLARAEEFGIDLPEDAEGFGPVLHAQTGAIAVKQVFPELPDRVVNAIAHHTTAAVNMSALDQIIFIADMIEPLRTKGDVDKIRANVGKVSLQDLFTQAFASTLIHLLRRKRFIHPDSLYVWNALIADAQHGARPC